MSTRPPPASWSWLPRGRTQGLPVLLVGLLFVSVALDANLYVGGLTHIYVHDLAAVGALLVGVHAAVRNRSVVPPDRRVAIPLLLLLFLLVNTVALGAVAYSSVPSDMQKLFWFEHGNALRIVGELFVWVWAVAMLMPSPSVRDLLLDSAAWSCALFTLVVGVYWYLGNSRPQSTTPFDLYVLVGLPIALYFVISRGTISDVLRLFVFGLATTLLYSRTAIVAVAIAFVITLLLLWRPRQGIIAVACMSAAWLVVVAPPAIASTLRARDLPAATSGAPAVRSSPTNSPSAPTESPTRSLSIATASPTSSVAAVTESPAQATDRPTVTPSPAAEPTTEVIGGVVAIERTQSIVDPALAPYTLPTRVAIWLDALRMAREAPILGVGYHNYFLHSRITEVKDASVLDTPGLFSSLIKQAHNDFLSWLAEGGLVGLVVLIVFWIYMLGALFKPVREQRWGNPQFALALGVALALLAVSAVGEILVPRAPAWVPAAAVWWLVLTLPLASRESGRSAVI